MQRAIQGGLRDKIAKAIGEIARGHTSEFIALQRVGFFLEKHVKELFLTRGDGTWAPLSPKTATHKGHDFPLIDSRELLESIDTKVEVGK